jgi:exonuclease SbcC
MIEALRIKNFQSHKHTELQFHAGVNCIIGASDSGKTAIFRALRWVVENRPSGQDFHSWWKGDPQVTLGLSNGIEITRERVKAENIYRMFQEDGEQGNPPQELEFKAFGQRVPEEVCKMLNLSPINFQWQMDNSFLLSQSSGEVARYLNGVVNLEDIDLALANIERRVKSEKAEAEKAKQDIKKYKAKIESYAWLAEVEPELEQLEKLNKEVDKTAAQIMCLSNMLDSIGYSERNLRKIESVLQHKGEVEKLIVLQVETMELEAQCLKLDGLLDDIDFTQEELEQAQTLTGLEGELNKLIGLEADVEELEEDIEELSDALYGIDTLQGDIRVFEDNLKLLRGQYDSEMPEICPLCEQPIKKKSRRGN